MFPTIQFSDSEQRIRSAVSVETFSPTVTIAASFSKPEAAIDAAELSFYILTALFRGIF
ncbi:hypothetical protein [Paenibacillus pseudetheri]|uniref:hypothetical protein n=1 Tax=Paenibacillus pseudetheri TaxID=2897682 RepID=UPI001F2B0386|nr:hypothetical protein [Paenibacillus pseudetheri]